MPSRQNAHLSLISAISNVPDVVAVLTSDKMRLSTCLQSTQLSTLRNRGYSRFSMVVFNTSETVLASVVRSSVQILRV